MEPKLSRLLGRCLPWSHIPGFKSFLDGAEFEKTKSQQLLGI